jgi:3-isopropylmalate/(R)-2-methylmalate dehydratase small subunit
MTPFTILIAPAAPLPIANIDTDQIIPKQFLSTVERTGLARGLFYDLRFDEAGAPRPDFVLNQPAFSGAGVLIAGPNFGCGSSREHAPWALLDFGIKCVVASSFADIFYNNCFNNGILPIILPQAAVDALMEQAKGANHVFHVDLSRQIVSGPDGVEVSFEIDAARKEKLLKGLDDIGVSLTREADITAFEKRRDLEKPWAARG